MATPNPKDALDAALQSRVSERAKDLFADGYTAAYVADTDTIHVTSPDGAQYQVTVWAEDCTCPFYKSKGYCKHQLGAQVLLTKCVEAQDAATLETLEEMEKAEDGRLFMADWHNAGKFGY